MVVDEREWRLQGEHYGVPVTALEDVPDWTGRTVAGGRLRRPGGQTNNQAAPE